MVRAAMSYELNAADEARTTLYSPRKACLIAFQRRSRGESRAVLDNNLLAEFCVMIAVSR